MPRLVPLVATAMLVAGACSQEGGPPPSTTTEPVTTTTVPAEDIVPDPLDPNSEISFSWGCLPDQPELVTELQSGEGRLILTDEENGSLFRGFRVNLQPDGVVEVDRVAGGQALPAADEDRLVSPDELGDNPVFYDTISPAARTEGAMQLELSVNGEDVIATTSCPTRDLQSEELELTCSPRRADYASRMFGQTDEVKVTADFYDLQVGWLVSRQDGVVTVTALENGGPSPLPEATQEHTQAELEATDFFTDLPLVVVTEDGEIEDNGTLVLSLYASFGELSVSGACFPPDRNDPTPNLPDTDGNYI